MQFVHPQILAKIINSVGLCFDMCGVVYIVYEIFVFQGKKQTQPYSAPPRDTREWEDFKEKHLTRGLTLILTGFLLQLTSNWIINA
jgi:hypothetical protein